MICIDYSLLFIIPIQTRNDTFSKKKIFGSQLKKKNYIFSSSFILSSNKNTFKSIDIKINFQISKNKTCYKF